MSQHGRERSASRGGHAHHLPSADATTRGLLVSAALTGAYFVVELAVGFWTGSIAVISDAFHTFSAVGGVLVALVAGQLANRDADQSQTFGLIRAEIVGALLNGIFLLLMAGLVLWMGAMRLRHPIELATTPMLVVAFGGLVTEVIALRVLYQGQSENLNIKGAYWHVLQTFVGSLIIIVSAIVIRFTGFLAIDPLLGMAFGLVLFAASWSIIRDSLSILLERTPKDLDLDALVTSIEAVPGVADMHHVHAWSLTSGKNIVTAHVRVERVDDAAATLRAIHALLRRDFDIFHSTIQIETECLDRDEATEIDIFHPGVEG